MSEVQRVRMSSRLLALASTQRLSGGGAPRCQGPIQKTGDEAIMAGDTETVTTNGS